MRYLFFSILILLTTSCSIEANISEMTQPLTNPIVVSEKATGAELNSGARPRLITGGSYQVSYSVGNVSGDIKVNTVGGYKVFSSVQGNVFSEDP